MPFDLQSFCKACSTEDPFFRSSYKFGEEVHKEDGVAPTPQILAPKV